MFQLVMIQNTQRSKGYTDHKTHFPKEPNSVSDLRPTSYADEVNNVELRLG